jgi:magnesium-protoporphyrin IX monomethyl ester (oxidative) cyclase
VVSNLTYLNDLADNGIKEIFIEDDNVISNPGLFSWILDRLRDNGISWSTPNGISARDLVKFVPRLRQSGCWRVSLPFETGNASTARLMRLGAKWMPFDGALSLVDALKAEGIKTCGFFIIGYPGETLDDMRKTLDYANTLPLDQRNIYIATPYPGTPLYEDCKREGWLVSDDYKDLLYTKGLIQTPEFTPGQVEALKARDREAAIARRGKK